MISSRKKLMKEADSELSSIRTKLKAGKTPPPAFDYEPDWWEKDEYKDTIGNDERLVRSIRRHNFTEAELQRLLPWAEKIGKKGGHIYQEKSFSYPKSAPEPLKTEIQNKLIQLKILKEKLYDWYMDYIYGEYKTASLFTYGMDYIEILDYMLQKKAPPPKLNIREQDLRKLVYFHHIAHRSNTQYGQWKRDSLIRLLRGIFGF